MTYDELYEYILKMGWVVEVVDFSALGLGFEIMVKQFPTKTCDCCGQKIHAPLIAMSEGHTVQEAQQQLVDEWE